MFGSTLLAPRADGGFATQGPGDDYWYRSRGAPTTAGVNVSEESAMGFPIIFTIVSKKSKAIATLPVHVFRDLPGDRKEKVADNPVQRMFTVRFNDEALAVPTRWAMMVNVMLWGNAYFEVIRNTMTGEVLAMRLLYSRYMTVDRDRQTSRLVYNYREPGAPPVSLPPEAVLHIAGMGFNGLVGMSVIGMVRGAAAMGLATTEFRAAFLGNGATTGLVVSRPNGVPELSDTAGIKLVNDIDERHQGSSQAFRTILLREGMTLDTIGMPMVDAQFVELSRYDRETWCGIFDVPPSIIHDNTRSTYDNNEQQGIQWTTGSLAPDCVLIESAIKATFFDGTDFYLKHNLDGLQRGDFKSRHAGYMTGRNGGWYSRNDIRRMEDLDPIEGGDDYLTPKNMGLMGEEGEQTAAIRDMREVQAKDSEAAAKDRELRAEQAERTKDAQAAVHADISGHMITTTETVRGLDDQIAEGQHKAAEEAARAERANQERAEAAAEVAQEQVARAEEVSKQGIDTVCDTVAHASQEQAKGRQESQAKLGEVLEAVNSQKQQATEKQHAALRGLLLDPATRAVAKETKAIANAFKRHSKAESSKPFKDWLDKFYTEQQEQLYELFGTTVDYAASQLGLSGPDAHARLQGFCAAEAEVSLAAVRGATYSSESPTQVLVELDRWKEEKPQTMAHVLMERLHSTATWTIATTESTESTESTETTC